MSEFWQYYAVRPATFDGAREALTALGVNAVLVPEEGSPWLVVVSDDHRVSGAFDLAIRLEDDEGSAWRLRVYRGGDLIGSGTFGTNVETGAKNQGFTGDEQAVADALGVDAAALRGTLNKRGLDRFGELTGIPVLPLAWDPSLPPGVLSIADIYD
jgi:hypothetical protein